MRLEGGVESPLLHHSHKELDEEEINSIVDACRLILRRYHDDEIWDETVAEIRINPVVRARLLQKQFRCGDIMHNRAKCRSCNDVIQSMSNHDYVRCKCGESFVDGGSYYCRMGGTNIPENLCENWPWVKYF